MMRASREFIVDSCHPNRISCQGPVKVKVLSDSDGLSWGIVVDPSEH